VNQREHSSENRPKSKIVTQDGIVSPLVAGKRRFLAFIAEKHPFAIMACVRAWEDSQSGFESPKAILQRGQEMERWLAQNMKLPTGRYQETTPFIGAEDRFLTEQRRLIFDVRGHFQREAFRASFTKEEKRWMLHGIILTRAVDNQMKQLFLSGEIKYNSKGIQGKGFRSLGQEAIYAGALRLHHGPQRQGAHGYEGDIVAPLIRDLGLLLAFTDDVSLALNAQAGKMGPPLNGKDLHYGDLDRGVLPAAAPLSIATCTVTGMALAMKLQDEKRIAISCIGEGGSSLGEWHEAINLAATHQLPMIFCVQNNQTALSTTTNQQSKARVFADKALGYGIPSCTLDGTDPEAIAASFAWASHIARHGGGPVLLELVSMRMCGHAHHDDMLYLGGEPNIDFALPEAPTQGYVDKDKYQAWATRDPLASYARQLIGEKCVTAGEVENWKAITKERCGETVAEIKSRPWPTLSDANCRVTKEGPILEHGPPVAIPPFSHGPTLGAPAIEDAPAFDRQGSTYLEAIAMGLAEILENNDKAFLLGEDVAAPYGNAFLLLKSLLAKHHQRIHNAPIAEGGIIGALVGASLEGMCPIGEMQFNDFVACGFNQLVNNAAMFHYRVGRPLPFVLRMPYGGLRKAGPYHSQDTIPWFYRAPGLKIVAPSTPHDARALIQTAAADPDPVLFYEHIALYREPTIRQDLSGPAENIPLGQAAFRKLGTDLSLISYGAFVHRALEAATILEQEDGISCDVLDLRSLVPLDFERIEATVRRTGRVLLVGEDSKQGSVLESIGSQIGESLFSDLDGPVRVMGALDTPVPYAPSLEEAYLVSVPQIVDTARAMLSW
jgi:2-oxoisovalerate dehydrogenase E1 component